ncbi:MAG: hypothetical protein DI527_10225 [Chelatococcus sp.]|nr:MAG: hypothetical protein DI527_10225 [Chelatococcus sp.]
MASLQKRTWTNKDGVSSTAWRVTYTDQSGRIRTKQFKKQSAAKAFRNTVTSTVADGTHVHDRDTITVKEAADIWLQATLNGRDGRAPVEQQTYKTYRSTVRNQIEPRLGSMKLSKLSRAAIAGFRDELLADGVTRFTTKRAVATLGSIIDEAMSRELVAVNRARGVKVATRTRDAEEDSERVEIPDADRIRDLISRARAWSVTPPNIVINRRETKNPRFARERGRMLYVLLRVSIATGMRISEVLGLPRANVDLAAGTISITQRLSQSGKIGKPKSRAGYRTLDVPADVVKELREWILQRPKGELDLVFPNASGGVELYTNFRRRFWLPLMQSVGAARLVASGKGEALALESDFTIHSLRHFHASQYIATGADPLDVKVRMGHSSIQVTYDVYGHLFQSAEAQARRRAQVERMEAELFGNRPRGD